MGGLAQKSGGQAVRRYGEMLVNDHKKADVDLLNYAAKMGVSMAEPGKQAAGKAVLDSMLPTLQKHLDSAQMALTRLGPQARRPE